jgi:multiple sugar transport system ATP-binding protein
MGALALRGITKRFGSQVVIDDLSLDIAGGEFVTLLGPSGCGKTTLLRMIAGLESIDQGELLVEGKRFNDVPAQKRPLAMVFQSYALFPHMNVRDNILFGLKIRKVPREQMESKLHEVVGMLSLEGLERRLPRQISGGQKQRVALARALVLDPDVLLLDEPLSNLDAALRDTAMEELKRIHRQVHKTVIYVTHNQVEAMTMSNRIAVLNKGRLEHYDTPRNVYDRPKTLFAAGFVGSPMMNFYDGVVAMHDGVFGVQCPLGFLALDDQRAGQYHDMSGREVRIGLRPHSAVAAGAQSSRRASDTLVGVRIEMVESMGDRSIVVARGEDDTILRFLIDREEELEAEERIDVVVDGRRVHVFDPRSGMNLFSC